MSQDNLVGYLS